MSDRNRQAGALLRAVDQYLRLLLNDTVDSGKPGSICGVTPGGRPPTWAGTNWYGIDGDALGWGSNNPQYHERKYGFTVTITVRVDAKPRDRLGNSLLMAIDTGIYDKIDEIADALHGKYDLFSLANTMMRSAQTAGVDIDQGFVTPPLFRGATKPVEQGAMWFGADPEKASAAGVSSTLTFGEVTYIRDNR